MYVCSPLLSLCSSSQTLIAATLSHLCHRACPQQLLLTSGSAPHSVALCSFHGSDADWRCIVRPRASSDGWLIEHPTLPSRLHRSTLHIPVQQASSPSAPMPVPIAEQEPVEAQRRDGGEQRVSSSRPSRQRTVMQRTAAAAPTSTAPSPIFADYSTRVQQLQSELNKVFDTEPLGSADSAGAARALLCDRSMWKLAAACTHPSATDGHVSSSTCCFCSARSDTQRKRELYRDTELARMDFCDEVGCNRQSSDASARIRRHCTSTVTH